MEALFGLIVSILVVGIGALILFCQIFKRSTKFVKSSEEENIQGKIILITGSNEGSGKWTAYELVRRGGNVIMACRNLASAKLAVQEIRAKTSNGNIDIVKLDLGSLKSVRACASEVTNKWDRIDILINNAGVVVPGWKNMKTEDGFEINIGVNYLGHFLLTNLLLEHLKAAGRSRVVIVGSYSYNRGSLNFDDLMSEKRTQRWKENIFHNPLYFNSKLAMAYFSQEFGRRLQGTTGVRSYYVCGGVVNSKIDRNLDLPQCLRPVRDLFMKYFAQNTEEGSQTTLYCVLSKACAEDSGKRYRNCDLEDPNAYYIFEDTVLPGRRKVNHLLQSDAAKLWEESEKLVELQ